MEHMRVFLFERLKKTTSKTPSFYQMMRALPLEERGLPDNYFSARTNTMACREPMRPVERTACHDHKGLAQGKRRPRRKPCCPRNMRSSVSRRSALSASGALAQGKGPVVGVSWSNFQEERWKTDEAAIKAARREGRRHLCLGGRAILARQAAHRHRKPDRPRRQGADRAGAGFGGGAPGRRQGRGRGHRGRGLRPPHRDPAGLLSHLRQRRGRPHGGARGLQGEAGGQLRVHQGLGLRSRTPISCSRARWRC